MHQFSIMSFNIKFGLANPEDQPNNQYHPWDKRKDIVISIIEKFSPDFICFQEVNLFQMKFLINSLSNYSFTGLYDKPNERWQDLPIFHKKTHRLIKGEHFFLSDTPKIKSIIEGSVWPRQFVEASFDISDHISGKKIIIINTHFDFKDHVQKKSAEIIKKRLEYHKHPIPDIFICGDFNADPTGVCHMEFFKQGFKDSFGTSQKPTFHDFTGIPQKGRIDWILYRGKNIKVLKSKVIMDSKNGVYPSDHFPVFTKFSLA